MRATLARDERVDLVDDDRVERGQALPCVRCEQKKERFRRRDEYVRCLTSEPCAIQRRRVTRANGDLRNGNRQIVCTCDRGDAFERCTEIALHVHRKRLERRDVQHAAPRGLRRRRREHQSVEAPEKCRERLAAAGRREDQRRIAARDRGPAERLRSRRRIERRGKPRANGVVKGCERVVPGARGHVVIL